jgi:hypothetical protein
MSHVLTSKPIISHTVKVEPITSYKRKVEPITSHKRTAIPFPAGDTSLLDSFQIVSRTVPVFLSPELRCEADYWYQSNVGVKNA